MIAQASTWYQAFTLKERLASLPAHPNPFSREIDTELADRLLKRWRTQAPFSNESLFSQRLDMDGITEVDLKYLLGESVELLSSRWPTKPDWLQQLGEAFNYANMRNGGRAFETILPEMENEQDQRRLLYLIEPLLDYALDRLRAEAESLTLKQQSAPFDSHTIVRELGVGLLKTAFHMSLRTMILELNVARLRGQLCGDTPDARFCSFVQSLQDRERAWALLEEYPVLARQLMIRIDCLLNFSLEFLQHLCDDWATIQAEFGAGNDLGMLTAVNTEVGDTHRGGRAVLIAAFSSGFKIVYKPKSLAIDTHFQELLSWLDERGTHPPFRKLKVIDRGKYGWSEFVAFENCASEEEVERFYQRQGGYLALLYALQATDFHLENLIAVGERPILVDLESLFHPSFNSPSETESELLASESMTRSVLRVGLLPQRLWVNEEGEGIDISGLGGAPGQLTPFAVSYCEGGGTDEMRLSRKRIILSAGQNRPSLNGTDVNVLEFRHAIIDGFTKVYRTLWQYRDELLADDGPLSYFAHDEVRVILRPSKSYACLLHESYHPDLLRHGLDRERYFDHLWIIVERWPEMARVIGAERDDLQRGDIPIFTTRISSLDLWGSGGQRIAGWFNESGLTLARRIISDLSEEDLERQVWFIRASLNSLSLDPLHSPGPLYRLTEPQHPAQPSSLLKMACRIGDRLEQIALRSRADATWIGVTSIDDRQWSLMPLGIDLYSGVPGIILFLAYLGEITGAERYAALARAACVVMQRQIDRLRPSYTAIGGFNGWGGVIYVLMHLGALWHKPDLLEQAEDLIDLIPNLIERDEYYDVITGSAGCIGVLLSHHLYTGSAHSIDVASQCGEHLIAHGQVMNSGLGWCGQGTDVPLSGFSHGAAGIAWALLQLAALTGEERYRATALESLEYERSLFSPVARGWSDLRQHSPRTSSAQDSESRFAIAWCHGAPGIGLGRLQSLSQIDHKETRAEIQAALEITLAQGFGRNHSLCHGDIGNLDFLLQAQAVFGEVALQRQIERLSAIVLEYMEQHGPLCGMPLGIETPGLMTGLAGIGYGLLRLADPARLPSALVLAPPYQ